jgi:hypothetical protein
METRNPLLHPPLAHCAQVGGKKELTGGTDIEIGISNQCETMGLNLNSEF